jgi:hypothetical protein
MKVTTWVIAVLVIAAGALTIAVRPAQGCPESAAAAQRAAPKPASSGPASSGPASSGNHRSFIIAARMGWL